jgi:hypothetical protein
MANRLSTLLVLLIVALGCAHHPAPVARAPSTRTAPSAAVATSDADLRNAVLRELLGHASVVRGYGTPGSRDVAIFSDVPYQPQLPEGWKLVVPQRDGRPASERPRLLGIRIEASPGRIPLHDEWESANFYRLQIFNAGGTSNGGIIGLCSGSARAEPTQAGCRAQILALFDP